MRPLYGGQSMVAPLLKVLMREPDENFCVPDPDKWHYTGTPHLQRARSEHRELKQIIESLGVETVLHDESLPGKADSIYVFDPALITDAGAILLNMGKRLRRGEETALGRIFEKNGIPILGRLSEPATAEGGDMFWLDRNTLAAGVGFRTNRDGIRQIGNLLRPFDITLLTADLPFYQGPDACLHLLSLISMIDDRLAVIYKPFFPVPLFQELENRGFEFIEVPDQEFPTMGCNILAIAPRVCIMLEGNPVTKSRIEKCGCRVFTYPGNEISLKAEGGPTCLTRPLLRDTELHPDKPGKQIQ
jgi:dimethylargininase